MEFPYLIKSKRLLVQYLACNLLPKSYYFYSIAIIPPDKDPMLVDAKLMLKYDCHVSKSRAYRRRKAGIATVRYFRVGRMAILIATKGTSPFFQHEDWRDARENPICVGGYSVSVAKDKTNKVSVRLHRETQRRLKLFVMRWSGKRSREWWQEWVRKFPFLPFAGVRSNLFALIRLLNANRKDFRQPPVDWKDCRVRKTFTPQPVFKPTPMEIADLLRYESRRRKVG